MEGKCEKDDREITLNNGRKGNMEKIRLITSVSWNVFNETEMQRQLRYINWFSRENIKKTVWQCRSWLHWGLRLFDPVEREIYIGFRGEWIFYTAHPILINGHPRTLNIGTLELREM